MFGKKLSNNIKNKIKEKHHNNSGENHPMFGKFHSEKTKFKMRASAKIYMRPVERIDKLTR